VVQENICGKVTISLFPLLNLTYVYSGESNVLDVCELCDGVGYIDFSTSTTTIQQLPNNLRNNNNKWIDEENNENM
jgi:hypothetical protein